MELVEGRSWDSWPTPGLRPAWEKWLAEFEGNWVKGEAKLDLLDEIKITFSSGWWN